MSERRNDKINERRTLELVRKAEEALAQTTAIRDETKVLLGRTEAHRAEVEKIRDEMLAKLNTQAEMLVPPVEVRSSAETPAGDTKT